MISTKLICRIMLCLEFVWITHIYHMLYFTTKRKFFSFISFLHKYEFQHQKKDMWREIKIVKYNTHTIHDMYVKLTDTQHTGWILFYYKIPSDQQDADDSGCSVVSWCSSVKFCWRPFSHSHRECSSQTHVWMCVCVCVHNKTLDLTIKMIIRSLAHRHQRHAIAPIVCYAMCKCKISQSPLDFRCKRFGSELLLVKKSKLVSRRVLREQLNRIQLVCMCDCLCVCKCAQVWELDILKS